MKKVFTLLFMASTMMAAAQTIDVTFNVNMANETTSLDGVFLAGGADFGIPGDNPMFDDGTNGDATAGDDIWSITMTLPNPYTGNYTFLNGNCPDWSCKENIAGLPCADASNFNDRKLDNIQANTVISTCFAQCTTDGTCATVAAPVDVTFKVDMNNEVVTGPVFIFGSFNGWNNTANPMDDSDGDGVYEVTIADVDQGGFEYKYVNDGTEEAFNPATSDSLCTITTGTFTNRYLFVDSTDPIVLDVNCFEECGECTGDPVLPSDVTFQVDMGDYAGTVGPVYLAGSLNGWNVPDIEMTDDDSDLIYQVTVMLDPGTYEYKFVNIGWGTDEILDEAEDADCTITTDGFTNRLVMVDTVAMTLDVVCYESCESCPVGIEDIAFAEFSVAPSITDDIAKITFGEISKESRILSIYNLAGVLVEGKIVKANESAVELSFVDYANGLYLINIETAGVSMTKKLVVSK